MQHLIGPWLARFRLDDAIHAHVQIVITTLPEGVWSEFLQDESFLIWDYEPGPGVIAHVPVGLPSRGRSSRSVVLKRTLRRRPADFAQYVIAHELAHAHLRNGGRYPGEDPEAAADALAAEWGFPRPTIWPWATPKSN